MRRRPSSSGLTAIAAGPRRWRRCTAKSDPSRRVMIR
uniref:Uncharacterized protein n=1 Tax=Arundo donax TaxID=35708 RepID=A0A0A9G0S9_ARUDO